MPARADLRQRLVSERQRFVAGPEGPQAQSDLARELRGVIADLEPQCLGLYWPQRGEFNAPVALVEDEVARKVPLALPFAQRTPRELLYRLWDGTVPTLIDDCGIASSAGSPVVPDVVLVPCVGYTDGGFRLGYGGGYFDRWLALHPDVCAVGVAWSMARLETVELAPMPHDVPLTLVVTERGTT
jgi:5-formyltetrahydrofolate cyclo-ligase